jgi:glycosyltransferase involved in cell wall biosynthesis
LGERTDVPELLSNHHALILGSFYEGLPNAICEALASGRPVLASDIGDHPILIQNNKTGFLFDPNKPEDIAECIYKFTQLSQKELTAMGHKARQFAEKHLSTDVGVTAYENLFKQLINNNRINTLLNS